MRLWFVFPVLMILSTLAARADLARIPALESVIQGQLDAFGQDDVATAFTYASPTIKAIFGTPDRFGQMVRSGYPMVWRPAEVRYLGLRREAGALWQRVMITDQQGALHLVDYEMIETPGGWQINGVMLKRDTAAGV
ncbi:DUF4864 domain-containing protein [Roseicitreum antarcticum]|uniref:DUF4864 domain-containing protein n=1 Tax=Roseicitreum antarcticum TaxID=564137 RepID=A0A1H3A114_9RHOB|nr:DUF4864 domain-containing protein [Roseicitreum antarcticum]SDX22874.1 protein of unknown function [Roseicitreum antarcticum]